MVRVLLSELHQPEPELSGSFSEERGEIVEGHVTCCFDVQNRENSLIQAEDMGGT